MSGANQRKSSSVPQGHLGWPEVAALLVVYSVTKVFYIFPARMSKAGETAAWSIPMFSAIACAFWLWALVSVLKAYPGKDIIAITRTLLGRYVAFALGAVFWLLNLGIVGTAGGELSEGLGITLLPLTPSRFFLVLGAPVIAYVAVHGIEVLSRMSVVVTFLVVVLLLVITVLSVSTWESAAVMPVLGPGVGPLLKVYGVRQSIYLEVLGIGVIAPYLRKPGDAGRAVRWAMGITAVSCSIAILACEMIFPFPSLNQIVEPLQRVTHLIYLGRFFQRFDAVLSPIWLSSAILHGSIGVAVASLTAASTLSLKSPRTLTIITVVSTVLAVVISGLMPNLSVAMAADFDLLHPYSIILLDTWPLALWVASRFHKRSKSGKGDSQG